MHIPHWSKDICGFAKCHSFLASLNGFDFVCGEYLMAFQISVRAKPNLFLFTVLRVENRRTFYRAIRTKYAAIAWLWLEKCLAFLAFIKVLASIDRHHDRLFVAAIRTSQRRYRNNRRCRFFHYSSSVQDKTDTPLNRLFDKNGRVIERARLNKFVRPDQYLNDLAVQPT